MSRRHMLDAVGAYANGGSTFGGLLDRLIEIGETLPVTPDDPFWHELDRAAVLFDLTGGEVLRVQVALDPQRQEWLAKWNVSAELGYERYEESPAAPGATRGLIGLGLSKPDVTAEVEGEMRSEFGPLGERWTCPECGLVFGKRDGHALFYPYSSNEGCADCRQILNLHHLAFLLDAAASELRPDGTEGPRFHAARDVYGRWCGSHALPIDVRSLRKSPVGLELLGHYRRGYRVLDAWGMRMSADSSWDWRVALEGCAQVLSDWSAHLPDGFIPYWCTPQGER